MEVRRLGERKELSHRLRSSWWAGLASLDELTPLPTYWLISGYGQRAWRAFAAVAGLLVAAAWTLAVAGFRQPPGFADALRFALRESTSQLRTADQPLTQTGGWIELTPRSVRSPVTRPWPSRAASSSTPLEQAQATRPKRRPKRTIYGKSCTTGDAADGNVAPARIRQSCPTRANAA
jgi:hypothetical protein